MIFWYVVCVLVRGSCSSFCRVILSVYAGGGSVCCMLGGSSCLYEFVPFGVIFVWKNWRGLRYGNFYVGGTNLGTFVCCVNVIIIYGKCLFACDLIGAFGVNF